MPRQITATWTVEDMEQTMSALNEAASVARALGHHPATVYPNMERIILTEKILTDGSTVMDVEFQTKPDLAQPSYDSAAAIAQAVRNAGKAKSAPDFAPSTEGKSVFSTRGCAVDPINRLLDCLQFWEHGDADTIHMSALAEDDGDVTIGDLVRGAIAARKGRKA